MRLREIISPSRGAALIWLLVLLALAAWVAVRMSGETGITANMISVLPTSDGDSHSRDAADMFRKNFERRMVFLVGAVDSEAAKAEATTILTKLQASGKFAEIGIASKGDTVASAVAFYLPLRFGLLSDTARQQLALGQEKKFEQDVLVRYFHPVAGLQSDVITEDPLHLLSGFLSERALASETNFEIEDGFLLIHRGQRVYVVLNGILNESPFSLDLQDKLGPILDKLTLKPSKNQPNVFLLKAGAFFHAAAGSSSAKSEISTVGVGALFGIVLLFFLVFRSWRPLALSLSTIAVGCLGGFVISLASFGQVNLLTLVFGVSLIGISVDYSLHYFCASFGREENRSSRSVLRHVLPGITLGLITSVIGFTGLLFASFPGIQQMAIFSGSGLICAYLCVVLFYPLLSKELKSNHMRRPFGWSAAYARFCQVQWGPKAWGGLAALLIVGGIGISQLRPQDDIRQLQTLDEAVVAEEKQVRELIGGDLSSQFFLVTGDNKDEVLVRQERLVEVLRPYRERGQLSGIVSLSDFVPSKKRVAENRRLIAPLIAGETSLVHRVAKRVGLPESTVKRYVDAYEQAKLGPVPDNLLSAWLENPMAAPYRQLWLGVFGGKSFAAVGLRGVQEVESLHQLAASLDGVVFIDTVGNLSDTFGGVRRQAIWLIFASYLIVSLFMLIRYGFFGGMAVMISPVVAAITSLGIQGLIGEPLTLFNVLAVLLVLGFGADYGIFFRETGGGNPSTLVAIALSSVTTMLAFGLLATSSTAAVHAFGMTILLGIFVALILSPLAGLGARRGIAGA